ncbi:MAG: ankyrin repeat domain-containing protein [Syntrophobacteraceae bacterium]
MDSNRFSKTMPVMLAIFVFVGLRSTPVIADGQNCHCKIINGSTLFVEQHIHLFGDLKVIMVSANDEYSIVEVDIHAPGYEERGVIIRRDEPVSRRICGNNTTLAIKAGGIGVLTVSGANIKDNENWAALFLASQNGRRKDVELLLSAGADVNAGTEYGTTALMGASQNGHDDIVELLLAHGADVNARMFDGWTSLFLASYNGGKKVVNLLLARGADVNVRAANGDTALMIASQTRYNDIVELLLSRGADINANSHNGETALFKASKCGVRAVLVLLIAGGADPNIKDKNGYNALMVSFFRPGFRGATEELLLARGLDVNARANDGATALMLAYQLGLTDIVEKLLARGAMQ